LTFLKTKQNKKTLLVAQAYNPSYSGGRDRKDHGLKPAQANSSRDPISRKLITKKADGVTQVIECLPSKHEALSSKPQYYRKKKKATVLKSRSYLYFTGENTKSNLYVFSPHELIKMEWFIILTSLNNTDIQSRFIKPLRNAVCVCVCVCLSVCLSVYWGLYSGPPAR
jgi:hypothetical protein